MEIEEEQQRGRMYKVKRVLLFGINTQLLNHPFCIFTKGAA
jgi:hypothetical protein